MTFIDATELRRRFAVDLAAVYGAEVPAYNTLLEASREVNAAVLAAHGHEAERLGDIDRITAERHGAIRVGSAQELGQVARVFAAFGMHPVGFYDLRTGAGAGVPVVSTAFRPIEESELARNPFRVFTSMLTSDDARYFDTATRAELARFIADRRLFPAELLVLADRAAADGGLPAHDARTLLTMATEAFRLSPAPIDRRWYDHLAAISSVAADIGGVASTHVNHLTPRVLDISALHTGMQDRGIEMIDAVQGPPACEGPDVLLRQTSFRALAERRRFRCPDGTIVQGDLRVRFGEAEQRGIALTTHGLTAYERAMQDIAQHDDYVAHQAAPRERQALVARLWRKYFPGTETQLAERGLGWFTYVVNPEREDTGTPPASVTELSQLVADRVLVEQPIVYEDFLPRSAAGIFTSNLVRRAVRDESQSGAPYDIGRLSDLIGIRINYPQQLYQAQRARSVQDAERRLGRVITDNRTTVPGTCKQPAQPHQ